MTDKDLKTQPKLPETHLSASDHAGQQVISKSYLPGGSIYKEMIQGMHLGGNPRHQDGLSASQWLQEWNDKQQQTSENVVEEEQSEKAKL